MKSDKRSNRYRICLSLCCLSCCQWAMAKCGGVDYTWGADGLAKAHDFIISLLVYTVYLCYAIAGIVAVIASMQIFFKMTNGQEGVKSEIQTLFWAVIFIISATIVMPAMFGYSLI